MNKTVCYIPLDDRPCNIDFPKTLAAMAGWNILSPSHEEPSSLAEWLTNSIMQSDSGVISLEKWVFGGLVQSRLSNLSIDAAVLSLKQLEDILTLHTSWPCSASTLLLRQAPTSWNKEDILIADTIAKLSEIEYKLHQGENINENIIRNLKESIPPGAWDNYIATRKRNLTINRQGIQMASSNKLQFLAIGLDDVTKQGINILEREELEKEKTKNTIVLSGADELGMALLARFFLVQANTTPSIGVRYSTKLGPNTNTRYEPDLLEKIISDQIYCIGGRVAKNNEHPDIWLFVHSPETAQQEATAVDPREGVPDSVNQWISDLNECILSGEIVLLADVACANGGDPRLMPRLLNCIPFASLSAYAAWNTTANTVGTVLAHGIIRWLTKIIPVSPELRLRAGKAHIVFLFARLIDDWFYQTLLRQELHGYLEEKGVSRFQLGGMLEHTEALLYKRLMPSARTIFNRYFRGKTFFSGTGTNIVPIALKDLEVYFPWKRTFEAKIIPKIAISHT